VKALNASRVQPLAGGETMTIVGWLGRGALALLGLLMAANVVGSLYLAVTRHLSITPTEADTMMWDVWVVSWIVAVVWSRPTAARPAILDQLIHWLPTLIGLFLLAFGSLWTNFTPLWRLPDVADWTLTGICAAGLLFTWWARISLGSLWSGSVSRKDDHTVIQSGPYRLVRHPIYTGLILAAFAQAIQIGQAANLLGALLMTFGFWLKARLEERFLSQELGADAYADYRRRTPMLIPFWRVRG
jgi:protein-S-isoprenylcysteine O-methyltransferase Ste14